MSKYPLTVTLIADPSRFDKDAFNSCVSVFSQNWNGSKSAGDQYVFLAGLLSLVYSKFFERDNYAVSVMTDRCNQHSRFYDEAMFSCVSDALSYALCLCIFYGKGVSVEVGFKAEGAYAFFDITSLCHELYS